jgi:hypothetical protein
MAGPRPRPLKRRSPREWALRGGIAAAASLLGYVSTTQTLAFAIGKSNPERAHALAPGDGRITAELAEQLAVGNVDTAQRRRADQLARQALVDEPLAVPALTALALDTSVRGDTAGARQLLGHSDALSRRELGTRLWLIEDAVGREDVPGALHHYDIALRTARGAPDLLFPVLSGAISDPAIATALAGTLAARPAWGEAFVSYLGRSGTDPVASAAFLRLLAKRNYPVPEAAQTGVVNALVVAGAFDDAWSYYASVRKGADQLRSRDPDFTAQLETPSAFDWAPMTSDAGVSASIQRTGDSGVFDFAMPSTVGGIVLQQAQRLAPGRYRLEGISSGIEQARGSRPFWQLACIDGRELGRVELPNSAENGGHFAGEFTVSGECKVQTLRLVARPSPEIGGVSGQIGRVLLAPIGGGR